ncbi:hypothetical protein PVL30_004266 [Lodderomyces elongisporus]|uniref:uncharacterized protein n=1 Tax=Lodderomyces elongisporus TaxID=36914 RepID=UPI002925CE69|nr:uncharacterized protein PVL30_004266 [Lodderomyces elongisporus]WLF80484.1 hypothetical protein PVL30_004266 [Lodderomyces elongisporus]
MTRLDNSQFLKQLNDLVVKNQGKSSIYLTQKRLSTPDFTTTTTASKSSNTHDYKVPNDLPTNVIESNSREEIPHNDETYPILIRIAMNSADNKKLKKEKVKLSTVVEIAQLNQFWTEYIQVIKNGFVGLKKKEKKNKSKKNKVSK